MLAKHNRSGTCMYGWCSRRIISMLDSDRTCLRNTDYGHCAVLGNVLIMQYLFTFRALWVLGGGGEGFLHISWTSSSRTLLLWPLCALRPPPPPPPSTGSSNTVWRTTSTHSFCPHSGMNPPPPPTHLMQHKKKQYLLVHSSDTKIAILSVRDENMSAGNCSLPIAVDSWLVHSSLDWVIWVWALARDTVLCFRARPFTLICLFTCPGE